MRPLSNDILHLLTVRWTVTISEATDQKLRAYLAERELDEHGHLFFADILFYKLFKGTAPRHTLLLLGFCLVLQFLVAPPESGLIVALFFVLFGLLLRGWLKVLVVPPLLFLGSISYSLYLLHQNIGYVVMRELYALEGVLPAWFILGVPFTLSLVLASLFTFYIERPTLTAMREHYRQGSSLRSLSRALKRQ